MKKLRSLFRDLTKDFRFTIAFVILLALLFLAILSFFSPYHPQRMYQVPRGRPPSWEHPLGTNWLGQDVFWQLTFAVRNSLLIAVITSLISRIIAIFVGMVAGYRGGLVDRILMIIGDTTMVLPSLVVLIVVSTILREWVRHLTNLGLLLAFFLLGLGCSGNSFSNLKFAGERVYFCSHTFRYANH